MIQRGDAAGFLLETLEATSVFGEGFGKDFDGYRAIETAVMGTINLAHSSSTYAFHYFIRAQARTSRNSHPSPFNECGILPRTGALEKHEGGAVMVGAIRCRYA